ncbi:hypothetical protein RHMOL_Rhmol07G0102300 [Rhododendron molle]|uniref:Uncharacterized protein n=1 Tax=Rhododendron molle TaxID=49168 RepID=A0ACC0MZC4_RHOML|nr:hypothetical protein RHMOL_Rhmol07G0102300 [Rhododendron molle]
MNDADVSKQIQQMVRFIRQEAEEKANEISVSAEEEFNIEKLQLVEAEKKKIRQEYERKEKQVEVRRKIEYSMQLNASRIKVLQAQDDVVNSMKEAAAKELLKVSRDHNVYGKLLKDLVVQAKADQRIRNQSLLRLKEPAVLLRCRKEDLNVVENILNSAKHEYAEKANVHAPEILVDKTVFLPPAPSHHDAHAPFCSGGVVLASRDGKIVFENTLDARSASCSLDKLLHEGLEHFVPIVYMVSLSCQGWIIYWLSGCRGRLQILSAGHPAMWTPGVRSGVLCLDHPKIRPDIHWCQVCGVISKHCVSWEFGSRWAKMLSW